MAFKPFKPPSIRSLTSTSDGRGQVRTVEPAHGIEPQPKRRKLSPTNLPGNEIVRQLEEPKRREAADFRTPLRSIVNDSSPEEHKDDGDVYFSVLWRKFTQKKNKTWDDDGYVSIKRGLVTLYDSRGKQLGQIPSSKQTDPGVLVSMVGREVEIGASISRKAFLDAVGLSRSVSLLAKDSPKNSVKGSGDQDPPKSKLSLKEQLKKQMANDKASKAASASTSLTQQRPRMPFKQPLKEDTVWHQVSSETPTPRHDPAGPDALVFKRPKKAPPGRQLVDVVLDPIISKHLREHQKDGIRFLYECVMDLRNYNGQGCILADDMGLGKTLQTIALLWTLIKQNPVYKAEPVVKKALIVCPVSLIQNWKKEFRKWLGNERLGVLTFGNDKNHRLSMFDGRNFKVMIVGYEKLRTIAEDLTKGAGIDIVICDEGHRLKTLQNKSAKAIDSLNTPRRIILSGTPIQNDLSEFFAMANFVNDGIFGSYKSFVKDFENPIMKSRQPNATEDDIEKGQSASEELAQTTSPFILRRTADILSKYLPPKTEYVLFCNPTPEQANVYRQVLKSPMFTNALGNSETALQLITILKKLCNSPALMRPDSGSDEATPTSSLSTLSEMLPTGISRLYTNRYSSKIRLLDELLQRIRTRTNDKVILVSNYTSTLNLMAQLLDSSGCRYLRLDGSVQQSKRQGLVDEFNRSPSSACFAFLLSAKAGGVGLNLIGANRLVLFDVDWNPATDDQAMARIHREGQKKHCKIYRFIIKGGLEERIWQRQVVKRGLADSIMESGNVRTTSMELGSKGRKSKAAFSHEELKDLFRLDEQTGLRTHDLIGCKCKGNGEPDADLSATHTPGDGVSDAEDELPDTSSLIKASKLTDAYLEEQERLIATGRHPRQAHAKNQEEQEKQELMQYLHLDTEMLPDMTEDANEETLVVLDAAIDDDALMHVLKLDDDVIAGRIAHVFKKTTGPKTEE